MEQIQRVHGLIGRAAEAAPVIVRVILGYVMAAHGWDKLSGGREAIDGLGAFLGTKNVPLPDLVAWLVTAIELGGGILLILGLFSRWSALLIAIELILAALVVTRTNGLIGAPGGGVGYERDIVYVAAAMLIFLQGPGRPSVDHRIGLEQDRVAAAPVPASTGAGV